jgi:hypothetical protein
MVATASHIDVLVFKLPSSQWLPLVRNMPLSLGVTVVLGPYSLAPIISHLCQTMISYLTRMLSFYFHLSLIASRSCPTHDPYLLQPFTVMFTFFLYYARPMILLLSLFILLAAYLDILDIVELYECTNVGTAIVVFLFYLLSHLPHFDNV